MKKKATMMILAVGLIAISCSKKKCTCTEKQYSSDNDIANQRSGSNSERAVYNYQIGQSAMNPDGTSIKYTKEYIEQQVSELEATGKFNCEWKY